MTIVPSPLIEFVDLWLNLINEIRGSKLPGYSRERERERERVCLSVCASFQASPPPPNEEKRRRHTHVTHTCIYSVSPLLVTTRRNHLLRHLFLVKAFSIYTRLAWRWPRCNLVYIVERGVNGIDSDSQRPMPIDTHLQLQCRPFRAHSSGGGKKKRALLRRFQQVICDANGDVPRRILAPLSSFFSAPSFSAPSAALLLLHLLLSFLRSLSSASLHKSLFVNQ